MTGLRAGRPSDRSAYAGPGDSVTLVSVAASSARSGTTLASGWSLIRSAVIVVSSHCSGRDPVRALLSRRYARAGGLPGWVAVALGEHGPVYFRRHATGQREPPGELIDRQRITGGHGG